jgi:uncharacterized membrane protein
MEAPWWIRKPVDVWRRLGRSRATGGAGDDKAGCARGRDGEPLRRGDRLVFTATTAVFQPLSGLWLMHLAGGMPLATPWIAWSLWLYVLAIACWRPVCGSSCGCATCRCRRRPGSALPKAYWHLFRWWVGLGCVAFVAFLAIFYLMVVKRPPFSFSA